MPAKDSVHIGNAMEKARRTKPIATGIEGLAGMERRIIDSKTIIFINPNKGNLKKR
ncbi:MAG TPA: hypothetical protein VMW01_16485 [Williamwhitmania sp.]|nr:hypothetical protein [Williamwhitmania sp.]